MRLLFIGAVLSEIVGDNPAAMLPVPYLDKGDNSYALWAALVLGTGFALNLFVFASIAGIIVLDEAKKMSS